MQKHELLAKLFQRTIIGLRTMGFLETSFADITFVFLFWKYLSDTKGNKKFVYPGEEADFNFVNSVTGNKELSITVERALKKWSSVNEFGRLMELNFSSVNLQFLPNIFHYWRESFNLLEKDFWTLENIKLAHDVLNSSLSSEFRDAHLLFTPSDIQKLLVSMLEKRANSKVYDPFCRSGGMLFELAEYVGSAKLVEGVTADVVSYKATKIISLMMDKTCAVRMEPLAQLTDRVNVFDRIVTNPPFGHSSSDNGQSDKYWSTTFPSKRTEIRYLTHCLDHLSETGQASIIVPRGFLSWSDRTVVALRQALIKRSLLEGVIQLPGKIFFGTGTATAVLVLNRRKRSKGVILVDATKLIVRDRDRVRLTSASIDLIISWIRAFREGTATELSSEFVQVSAESDAEHQGYTVALKTGSVRKEATENLESLMIQCAQLQFEITGIQQRIESLAGSRIIKY